MDRSRTAGKRKPAVQPEHFRLVQRRPKENRLRIRPKKDTLVKVHEAKRNEIIYGFGFEVSHRGGNVPTGTVAVPGLPHSWAGQ